MSNYRIQTRSERVITFSQRNYLIAAHVWCSESVSGLSSDGRCDSAPKACPRNSLPRASCQISLAPERGTSEERRASELQSTELQTNHEGQIVRLQSALGHLHLLACLLQMSKLSDSWSQSTHSWLPCGGATNRFRKQRCSF